jgi:hypothetical protein
MWTPGKLVRSVLFPWQAKLSGLLCCRFERSHCIMMLSQSSWPLRVGLHRGLSESIGPVIAPTVVCCTRNYHHHTIHVASQRRFIG